MSHEHGNSGSGHSHAPVNFNTAFAIGIGLNTAYVLFEVVFGLVGHSLALLADAGHNLSDVLGLLLAWGASAMGKSMPTILWTGFHWIDPVVSLLICAVIVWSTWDLLRESVNLALQGVPKDVDLAEVEGYLAALPASQRFMISTSGP